MPACPACHAALLAVGGHCPACGAVTRVPVNAAHPTASVRPPASAPPTASIRRTAIEIFPDEPNGRLGHSGRRPDDAKETLLEPPPASPSSGAGHGLTPPAPPVPPPVEAPGNGPVHSTTKAAGKSSSSSIGPVVAAAEPLAPDTTPIFRPQRRPPVPRLVALDDGQLVDGEVFRLRVARTVIGRIGADIVLAGDPDISAKHVELACVQSEGRARWRLTDLKSTNGTFVRINRAPLADKKELILASHRYRFHILENEKWNDQDIRSTRAFAGPAETAAGRVWLEWLAGESTTRFDVPSSGATVGSDERACDIVPPRDPFLSPMHARISCVRGRWQIEDVGSVNGTWMRIERVMLDQDAEFQIGEQRFRFLLSRGDGV